jgi:hypothetical protein
MTVSLNCLLGAGAPLREQHARQPIDHEQQHQ